MSSPSRTARLLIYRTVQERNGDFLIEKIDQRPHEKGGDHSADADNAGYLHVTGHAQQRSTENADEVTDDSAGPEADAALLFRPDQ